MRLAPRATAATADAEARERRGGAGSAGVGDVGLDGVGDTPAPFSPVWSGISGVLRGFGRGHIMTATGVHMKEGT
ncbi:hypothetical protein GCM10009642_21840 [Nocardiopsis metallicus]